MPHMHACNYVEVRMCLSEGVDHIVQHIGTKASLSIYPPARTISSPCAQQVHDGEV